MLSCWVSTFTVNHSVSRIRATDLIYHTSRADTGFCTEETLILFLKSEIIFLCIIIDFFWERSQMMLSLIGNLSKEHQDSIRNVIPKWDSQDSSCSSFKWEETRKMNKQWIIHYLGDNISCKHNISCKSQQKQEPLRWELHCNVQNNHIRG